MAVTIGRTAWVDDDGSGTFGTVINNAVKTGLYDQIDTALALLLPLAGGTISGALAINAVVTITSASASGALSAFTSASGRGATINPSITAGLVDIYADYLGGAEPKLHLGTYTNRGGIGGVTIDTAGAVGINTNSPSAQLHTTGTVRLANFGAGTATFDASGNVSSVSDGRLKEFQGLLPYGLQEVLQLVPIVFRWRPESGMETAHEYPGFDAQAVADVMPLAGPLHAASGYRSLDERGILGALVNACRELTSRLLVLEAQHHA